MKNIKHIIKESKYLNQFLLSITIGIIFTNIISEINSFNIDNGFKIFCYIFISSILFVSISSIFSIISNFKLSIIFNSNRLKIFKAIQKYTILKSFANSIFIVLLGILLKYTPSEIIIPNLFGSNWNLISYLPINLLISFLILYFFANLNIFLALTFYINNWINNLIQIILLISIFIFTHKPIIDYIIWGNNKLIILALISFCTIIFNLVSQNLIFKFEVN